MLRNMLVIYKGSYPQNPGPQTDRLLRADPCYGGSGPCHGEPVRILRVILDLFRVTNASGSPNSERTAFGIRHRRDVSVARAGSRDTEKWVNTGA